MLVEEISQLCKCTYNTYSTVLTIENVPGFVHAETKVTFLFWGLFKVADDNAGNLQPVFLKGYICFISVYFHFFFSTQV